MLKEIDINDFFDREVASIRKRQIEALEKKILAIDIAMGKIEEIKLGLRKSGIKMNGNQCHADLNGSYEEN